MSHAADSTTRRIRRGRILLVGEEDASQGATAWGGAAGRFALGDSVGRVALHAENLFDAIGQLTAATAREPIELVCICDELLATVREQAIAAIRRVDPAARLVLISQQANVNGIAAKFDAVIAPPLEASAVQRMLDGVDTETAAQDSPASEPPPPAPAQPQSASEPPPFEPTQSCEQSPAVEHDQQAQSPAHFSAGEETMLGDVDLVEAITTGREDVAGLAVQLIRQQTNWDGLTFAVENESAHGAIVACEEKVFGLLTATSAPAGELEAWAQWLARWLALDAAHRGYRYMAFHDELTGAWNRRYFQSFLADAMNTASKRRRPVTVMVLDIDDFKQYNDQFGHAAGDDILRETARLLQSVIRQGDRVCRIGGDEFAVVFADTEGPREVGSMHPENVEQIAHRFQEQICKMRFPKLGADALATLSVSAGLATYPWDGSDPDALLDHADQLALQSKRRGKNAITLGPGAQQVCQQQNT